MDAISRSAGAPVLIVSASDSCEYSILLSREVTTIGRHPDDTIFLADLTVSPHHATIRRTADGFVLEDRGSVNGTYVNRARVEHRLLVDGDRLQVGRYRLTYRPTPAHHLGTGDA